MNLKNKLEITTDKYYIVNDIQPIYGSIASIFNIDVKTARKTIADLKHTYRTNEELEDKFLSLVFNKSSSVILKKHHLAIFHTVRHEAMSLRDTIEYIKERFLDDEIVVFFYKNEKFHIYAYEDFIHEDAIYEHFNSTIREVTKEEFTQAEKKFNDDFDFSSEPSSDSIANVMKNLKEDKPAILEVRKEREEPNSLKESSIFLLFATILFSSIFSFLVLILEDWHKNNTPVNYIVNSLDSIGLMYYNQDTLDSINRRLKTTELLCYMAPQTRTEALFTEAEKEYCKELTKNNRVKRLFYAPSRFFSYIGFAIYSPPIEKIEKMVIKH